MDSHHLENLLHQILAISKRYEKINELTGENFNLFRVLRLEASEVRLHSALLGELLNPKGTHGQKDTFLKLFVEKFLFKKNEFDTNNANIEIEKYTGFLNEEKTQGGRIDLILSDENNNQIIIENKIYAGDQENQILRYYNHSQNADLFYLTLEGDEPIEYSRKELVRDVHFKCLSYKKDIIEWLESCRKEVAVNPILRETITQYINLIKYFTNQTTNYNMGKELSDVILSNLEASFIITNNINTATDELLEKLESDVESVAKELNIDYGYYADLNSRYTGFHFSKSNWEYTHIVFQFSDYGKSPMQYGICAKEDPTDEKIPNELRIKIADLFKDKVTRDNDWWLYHKHMPEPYNYNWKISAEPWINLKNGKLKNLIRDRAKELLNIIADNDI